MSFRVSYFTVLPNMSLLEEMEKTEFTIVNEHTLFKDRTFTLKDARLHAKCDNNAICNISWNTTLWDETFVIIPSGQDGISCIVDRDHPDYLENCCNDFGAECQIFIESYSKYLILDDEDGEEFEVSEHDIPEIKRMLYFLIRYVSGYAHHNMWSLIGLGRRIDINKSN